MMWNFHYYCHAPTSESLKSEYLQFSIDEQTDAYIYISKKKILIFNKIIVSVWKKSISFSVRSFYCRRMYLKVFILAD